MANGDKRWLGNAATQLQVVLGILLTLAVMLGAAFRFGWRVNSLEEWRDDHKVVSDSIKTELGAVAKDVNEVKVSVGRIEGALGIDNGRKKK